MPPRSTAPRHGFELAQVTDSQSLEALYPEWLALWTRVADATPFQSPDWLIPWWEHLGDGALLVLTLRRNHTLVGVAPFCIYADMERDRRDLFLLGTGVSDYGDLLLDDDIRADGTAVIVEALAACDGEWDAADLQQLRPESVLLDANAPRGLIGVCEPGEPCLTIALPSCAAELDRVIPPRTMQEMRYLRRRIAREGCADVETATCATVSSLLDILFDLHGARWSVRALSGMLGDEAVRRFHRDAARALLAHGVLRLYALHLDDRVIAVLYGFTHRRRAYYYIGGFDPAYARLSPGSILVGHAIEQAVREGARAFDFLRGREAYKYHWGATDHPVWRRCLTHATTVAVAGAAS